MKFGAYRDSTAVQGQHSSTGTAQQYRASTAVLSQHSSAQQHAVQVHSSTGPEHAAAQKKKMKQAKKADKAKVVSILEKSFAENKTLLFLTRKRKHIRKVAEYAFDYALRRKGVFLSDSGNGVAICYQYNHKKKDWLDYFFQIKLFFGALSLKRAHKIMAHTKKIENSRPKDGNFLYFWFFGAKPESLKQNSAKELYLNILKLAHKKQLNIYAETTILKNKKVYERFGFEVYKQWFNPDSGFNVWFLRKLVVSS